MHALTATFCQSNIVHVNILGKTEYNHYNIHVTLSWIVSSVLNVSLNQKTEAFVETAADEV